MRTDCSQNHFKRSDVLSQQGHKSWVEHFLKNARLLSLDASLSHKLPIFHLTQNIEQKFSASLVIHFAKSDSAKVATYNAIRNTEFHSQEYFGKVENSQICKNSSDLGYARIGLG